MREKAKWKATIFTQNHQFPDNAVVYGRNTWASTTKSSTNPIFIIDISHRKFVNGTAATKKTKIISYFNVLTAWLKLDKCWRRKFVGKTFTSMIPSQQSTEKKEVKRAKQFEEKITCKHVRPTARIHLKSF